MTVATSPALRRLGLCRRLVYDVAQHALTSGRAEVLVMVADPGYFAAKIYESVGFRPTERTVGALRLPKGHGHG